MRQDMTMNNRVASTVRSLLLRLALTVAIFFVFAPLSRAGGPNCVAGDGGGETKSGNPAMPVILRVTQCSAASDVNGWRTSFRPVAVSVARSKWTWRLPPGLTRHSITRCNSLPRRPPPPAPSRLPLRGGFAPRLR